MVSSQYSVPSSRVAVTVYPKFKYLYNVSNKRYKSLNDNTLRLAKYAAKQIIMLRVMGGGGGVIREEQCTCDDAPKPEPLLIMTDGTRQIDTNYTRPSQWKWDTLGGGGWGKGNKRDENDTVNRFLVAERGVGRYLHAYWKKGMFGLKVMNSNGTKAVACRQRYLFNNHGGGRCENTRECLYWGFTIDERLEKRKVYLAKPQSRSVILDQGWRYKG